MKRLIALWLAIVAITITFTTLRLVGVFKGDTLDYVVGLTGLALSFSTLGMLILRTNPRHRVGQLFMLLSTSETIVVVLRLVATSLDPHAHTAAVLAIIEEGLRFGGITGAGVLILIFPNGLLLSWQWRFVAALFLLLTALQIFANAVTPGPVDGLPPIVNSLATARTAAWARAIAPAGGLGGIAIVAAAVSLILRLRRSTRAERQQIKLFVAAVLTTVGAIVGFTVGLPQQMDHGILGSLVWQLPWILPPAAAGYAIIRHGLFDIDRVIRRTVSYAIVSFVLAATFVAVVLGPSAIVGASGRTPSWLIALATLVVAFLFQPLRRRVQRAVDRRFDRARYDAAATVDAFTSRLRDEIDLETLERELELVVNDTMQPVHLGLWIAPRGS